MDLLKYSFLSSLLTLIIAFPLDINLNNPIKDTDWQLVNDEDNIKVYTRNTSTALKEIKMVMEFNTSIEQFMQYLNDANHYGDWVYKCTSSKVIERLSSSKFYYYTVTDLPFPTSDRDLVVKCNQWTDGQGTIHSVSKGVPNYIPKEKEYIRIPMYESSWQIRSKGNHKIHITYQSKSDPGGWIPIWLVNLAITTGPLKTMQALGKLLEN